MEASPSESAALVGNTPQAQSPSQFTPAFVCQFLSGYLLGVDRTALACCSTQWRYWWLATPVVPRLEPSRVTLVKRQSEFGRSTLSQQAEHDRPSPHLIMHFVWEFLSLEDRWKVTHLLPFIRLYARLRCTAVRSHELQPLRRPRPPPSGKPIDLSRTWKMGAALLAFNFVYGDLIRWLGGEYTDEHRDWPTMLETLDGVRAIQPPPSHPVVDIDRAYATCTQGAPLAGRFECTLQDVLERNRYDNHPTLQGEHSEAVRKKLAMEEKNSFHLILP